MKVPYIRILLYTIEYLRVHHHQQAEDMWMSGGAVHIEPTLDLAAIFEDR